MNVKSAAKEGVELDFLEVEFGKLSSVAQACKKLKERRSTIYFSTLGLPESGKEGEL
jgi:hypothetical protein